MSSGLEITAHPTGPWLVKAGETVYAVPATIGRPLLKWHGLCPTPAELAVTGLPPGVESLQWAGFLALVEDALRGSSQRSSSGVGGARLLPSIWLRLPLLPVALVRWLAQRLVWWAGDSGLLLLVVMGLAGYMHLGLTMAANPVLLASGSLVWAIAWFLLTAVWHELGHAAALARYGYPPGGIGFGVLFVIPVLFADVTAVGALPRSGRLRVDAAGVVFQLGLGGLLAVCGVGTGSPALVIASWLVVLAVCWSLLPFVRADGYWFVCDLVGVVDLESNTGPEPARGVGLFLRVYRLANAVFLLAVGFLLPWRYAHRAEGLLGSLGVDLSRTEVFVPLLLGALAVLGLVWWSLLRRVGRLLRGVWR